MKDNPAPNWLTCLLRCVSDPSIVGVCANVRGEWRELPDVGALAICNCRWVCHGVLGAVRAWLLGRVVANLLTQYCKHEV